MTISIRLRSVSALMAGVGSNAHAWLSPAERARMADIRAPRRAAQFVAGRWLARALLAERFGGVSGDWRIEASPNGAPLVARHADKHVSIAHVGDSVACAVSNRPIGLDLEMLRPGRSRAALLEAITDAAERSMLLAGRRHDAETLALEAWTLKEAALKCRGGELFSTMLGHRSCIRPAGSAHPGIPANGCSWWHGDTVVAVVSDPLLPELDHDGATPDAMRQWQVAMAGSGADFPQRSAASSPR
ncbi:4'-phosphopantetheinyl transferase family protein [Cupriavidus gilardii]|uniref:4'-phosphopantetheinyl transferase family protein n=1 Tax=Cupriavidus gilardii TaxID=82541 RepID=UPI0018D32B7A|nr:4'-phosphopantetheinyl transferase superfamily protein [Cupriavidus gilardii]